MRVLRIVPLVIVALVSISATGQRASTEPVVVELFTAEGCSSCPPADALLAALARTNSIPTANVIILGEHVDYWNAEGWTDRFSSAAFTQRQKDYDWRFNLNSVYTPQMVIDGRVQVSGNNRATIFHDIQSAASEAKPAQVTLQWESPSRLHIAVQLAKPSAAEVLLAITEDGLKTEVTKGENQGRTLQHDGVVRQLRTLGAVAKGEFATTVDLSANPNWNPNELKYVVLVQQKHQGAILGAASTKNAAQAVSGQ